MHETQKQAGKQAGKQTMRQAVGVAILEGGLCTGVSGWKLMGTHSCTGRVGGGNGRSAAIRAEEEMGLETPAVRRCGQARPGAQGRGAGQQQEKGSARFCSAAGGQAGGREGAPQCPVRRGVEWAGLHMVDAWAGGFDAGGLGGLGWALPCCPPPWSPGRGSTGCVQMVPPAHLATPGHPPRLGCFNGPVGLAAWARVWAGTVPDLVACVVYPAPVPSQWSGGNPGSEIE